MKPYEFDKSAAVKTILDKWANEVNAEALMSLDPAYLEGLKRRTKIHEMMAELLVGHLDAELQRAYEAGLQARELTAP